MVGLYLLVSFIVYRVVLFRERYFGRSFRFFRESIIVRWFLFSLSSGGGGVLGGRLSGLVFVFVVVVVFAGLGVDWNFMRIYV